MIDWRTILKAPTPPQNTQNPQKESNGRVFEDIADIAYRKSVTPISQGDRITWEGPDLTARHGFVDFLHADGAGVVWAFVTLPHGGWAAVNTKYVERIDS